MDNGMDDFEEREGDYHSEDEVQKRECLHAIFSE